MISDLADVKAKLIGSNTTIWQFAVILEGAKIGSNCNVNCHTFIENNVCIGDNVTIKSGVFLWDGITIKDNVFIGPNVSFTNDLRPRSKKYPSKFQETIIEEGASIGAAAIILGGIRIGSYSMIAAGALVTKDVPSRALVKGSPAIVSAWLNKDGTKMILENGYLIDNENNKWQVSSNNLIQIHE